LFGLGQQLLDEPFLLFGELNCGAALPAIGQHQPHADRHRRVAIGAGAENRIAIEPDLARRSGCSETSGGLDDFVP
jgi:hypothetical protein